MEHNDLGKLFRDMIQKDESGLTKEELTSKTEICDQLDLPSKGKLVTFPIWKLAAGILFLLLGGSLWMMQSNLKSQATEFANLEQEYELLKNNLAAVEQKLIKENSRVDLQETNIKPTKEIIKTNTIFEKEFIDRIVAVRDTLWMEKMVNTPKNIQLVRDTIFIEVPAKSPARWTSLESKTPVVNDSISKKKRPSKVEFVFGKKELKRQEEKQSIFLKTEVAKKSKKKKGNPIFLNPHN